MTCLIHSVLVVSSPWQGWTYLLLKRNSEIFASFQFLCIFRAWGGPAIVGKTLAAWMAVLEKACTMLCRASRVLVVYYASMWAGTVCSVPVLHLDNLPQTQPGGRRVDFYKVMLCWVLSTSVWVHAILIPGTQGCTLAGIEVFSILSSLSFIRNLVSFPP